MTEKKISLEKLPAIIEQMSLHDIVLAVILTKKNTPLFKEEALGYAFTRLSEEYK